MNIKTFQKDLEKENAQLKEQLAKLQSEASVSNETEVAPSVDYKAEMDSIKALLVEVKSSIKDTSTSTQKTAEAIASLGVKAPVGQITDGDNAPVEKSNYVGLKRTFSFKGHYNNESLLKSLSEKPKSNW